MVIIATASLLDQLSLNVCKCTCYEQFQDSKQNVHIYTLIIQTYASKTLHKN